MSLVDPGLLKILRCPETHQPVSEADATIMARVNARIAAGGLKNRAGKRIERPLDGGLIREDGQVLYPIRSRLPLLLIEEAISLV